MPENPAWPGIRRAPSPTRPGSLILGIYLFGGICREPHVREKRLFPEPLAVAVLHDVGAEIMVMSEEFLVEKIGQSPPEVTEGSPNTFAVLVTDNVGTCWFRGPDPGDFDS
jgi:hypothetical protein